MVWKKIKKLLRKILPASYSKCDSNTEKLLDCLRQGDIFLHNELKYISEFLQKIEMEQGIYKRRLDAIEEIINQQCGQFRENIIDITEELNNCHVLIDDLRKQGLEIIKHIDDTKSLQEESSLKIQNICTQNKRMINEAVWGEIFNNTIATSVWLTDRSFSPGRWALGYPALYVLYRVLEEFRPQNILELGLGQSTKMISQFVSMNNTTNHYIVEHDSNWISFYLNNHVLCSNSQIVQLDRTMAPYKEAEKVRVFSGFKEQFAGMKFDLIIIDAPLGGDMKEYSRIDILSILPHCLESSFVIILDDVQRTGEYRTMREIDSALKDIIHKRGVYSGDKDTCVWASEDLSFLCTL